MPACESSKAACSNSGKPRRLRYFSRWGVGGASPSTAAESRETTMQETWKDIPGFEGMYQASDQGRIKSLDRLVGHNFGGMKALKGRIMQLSTLPGGYKIVALRKGGQTHKCRVARLVLSAFVGQPDPGDAACHKDNDPRNNSLENLRWDTYAGNEADKVAAGTDNACERNGMAVLDCDAVASIRHRLAGGQSGRSLAEAHGVSPSTISAIKSGRTWCSIN